MTTLTKDECKRIIYNLGIKFNVPPNIIATRMLRDRDKNDMLLGVLDIVTLEASVEAWKNEGMPDRFFRKESQSRQTAADLWGRDNCHYLPPFVCGDWRLDCHCRQKKA